VVSECLLRIGAKTKKRGDMTSEDVAPPPPGTYFCHCKRNATKSDPKQQTTTKNGPTQTNNRTKHQHDGAEDTDAISHCCCTVMAHWNMQCLSNSVRVYS
jgi:hypothetical protein